MRSGRARDANTLASPAHRTKKRAGGGRLPPAIVCCGLILLSILAFNFFLLWLYPEKVGTLISGAVNHRAILGAEMSPRVVNVFRGGGGDRVGPDASHSSPNAAVIDENDSSNIKQQQQQQLPSSFSSLTYPREQEIVSFPQAAWRERLDFPDERVTHWEPSGGAIFAHGLWQKYHGYDNLRRSPKRSPPRSRCARVYDVLLDCIALQGHGKEVGRHGKKWGIYIRQNWMGG